MKYKPKPCIIDAVQWNKPGDHPAVNKYYKVSLSDAPCDWVMIHPGNYILTHSDGRLEVMPEAEFLSKYEKVTYDCLECDGDGAFMTYLGVEECKTCNGTGKVEE